jgi:CBS domain-containing protein
MSTKPWSRHLIRADGTLSPIERPLSMREIATLIGADTLDTVMLRALGRPLMVMVVDDLGIDKDLPVNPIATAMYRLQCLPGTTHQIRGDVVITFDDDFAGPEGSPL